MEDFFRGPPGRQGRPGSTGKKGPKGMINLLHPVMIIAGDICLIQLFYFIGQVTMVCVNAAHNLTQALRALQASVVTMAW